MPLSPPWAKFDALVQRHNRRIDREFDEYHDGWLYCWCDSAQAIREAARRLKIIRRDVRKLREGR